MIKRAVVFVAILTVSFIAVADDKDKFDAKCPVSGMKAKKAQKAEYKGGEVYFCCGNCAKAFAKDSSKHAAKANHQLVSTGQAKQEKCPFSGGKAKDGTEVEVNGVSVKFCCNNCQGKAKKSTDQINLIFSDKAFDKGFKVAKKEKK